MAIHIQHLFWLAPGEESLRRAEPVLQQIRAYPTDSLLSDGANGGLVVAIRSDRTPLPGSRPKSPLVSPILRRARLEGVAMSTAMTEEERDAFLADLHVGVLSIEQDGRPPLSVPIWYDYAPGVGVWVITGDASLRRDT